MFTFSLLTLAVGASPYPSAFQVASLARQLVKQEGWGNIATLTKVDDSTAAGFPFVSVDAIASDCAGTLGYTPGSLLLFISPLEENYKNYKESNKISIAVRDTKNQGNPLTLHRATFSGTFEELPEYKAANYKEIADCFFNVHPFARNWEYMPSHSFRFHRFTPTRIHWIGGFGNTHYIGPIDVELYKSAFEDSSCSAWPLCSDSLEGKCCPYDSDNAFRSCCKGPEGPPEEKSVDELLVQ